MTSEPRPEVPGVPEGIRADAAQTWPSRELISSWLGDQEVDFELRPGEDVAVTDAPEAVDAARRFRDVLGRYASGVTVVTTIADGAPAGLTCQSFASVSLQPPLVLFVVARSSRAWPLIHRSGRFTVNVLAADQEEVSRLMATRGADKFAAVAWRPAPQSGSPLIAGALAHVDCAVHAVHEAGDHYVVIGRVLDLLAPGLGEGTTERGDERGTEGGTEGGTEPSAPDPSPLLYYRGRYRTTDGD